MHIKKLIINGFKKFENFVISFNEGKNVIVGENESGKSTIIEAIDIVLGRKVFNKIDSSLIRYLNRNQVNKFFINKNKNNLPRIEIEIFLQLDSTPNSSYFSGHNYSNSKDVLESGIKFVFEFNNEFISIVDFSEYAENSVVPVEYYSSTWTTFQGSSYNPRMLGLTYILLDNSARNYDVYGGYARRLYRAKINDLDQKNLSTKLMKSLFDFENKNNELLSLNNSSKIGIDKNKSEILKLIDVFENDISIQDMGRGKENIIKTELALSEATFDVVLIEEPENHLSHSNTKKLLEIINKDKDSQMIVTTHSSMIVNNLDIRNLIWINQEKSRSLEDLDTETAKYFFRIDNLDILKFILSEKVILVEGAAEYILIPILFQYLFKENIDKYGIEIVSMGSLSSKRYRDLSEQLNKKVAVITDNDKKQSRINERLNDEKFKEFMDNNLENYTLEVSIYNHNRQLFDYVYSDKRNTPEYKGEELPKSLAYMLKNKTENAVIIVENIEQRKNEIDSIIIPDYIKEALEWIKR